MGDDLISFVNGRQPQPQFFRQIQDNHNVFVNGRQPQFGNIGKTTKILYILKLAMLLLAPASTELGSAQTHLVFTSKGGKHIIFTLYT